MSNIVKVLKGEFIDIAAGTVTRRDFMCHSISGEINALITSPRTSMVTKTPSYLGWAHPHLHPSSPQVFFLLLSYHNLKMHRNKIRRKSRS